MIDTGTVCDDVAPTSKAKMIGGLAALIIAALFATFIVCSPKVHADQSSQAGLSGCTVPAPGSYMRLSYSAIWAKERSARVSFMTIDDVGRLIPVNVSHLNMRGSQQARTYLRAVGSYDPVRKYGIMTYRELVPYMFSLTLFPLDANREFLIVSAYDDNEYEILARGSIASTNTCGP